MSTAYEEYQQMCAELEYLRNENKDLQQKLLASQLSEARLRQVLYYWREECTGFEPSISVFALKVDEALSQDSNTSELESFVAKAVECEIENRLGDAVAYVDRNTAGQVSIKAYNGDYFDMSKFVGCNLYAKRGE